MITIRIMDACILYHRIVLWAHKSDEGKEHRKMKRTNTNHLDAQAMEIYRDNRTTKFFYFWLDIRRKTQTQFVYNEKNGSGGRKTHFNLCMRLFDHIKVYESKKCMRKPILESDHSRQ